MSLTEKDTLPLPLQRRHRYLQYTPYLTVSSEPVFFSSTGRRRRNISLDQQLETTISQENVSTWKKEKEESQAWIYLSNITGFEFYLFILFYFYFQVIMPKKYVLVRKGASTGEICRLEHYCVFQT